MKISYNWLKQYVDTDLSAEKAGELLTASGLEVESLEKIETIKGGLRGVVVGEVKTCVKHPDADRLSVTTVDVGQAEVLHIVCGAPNVAAGQKVLVATIGTKLYSGDEAFEIKKSKIRGELSEGMICAEDELGVGTSHDGIMVLPADTKIGTTAREYFNITEDYMFEIGLTPNRSDAASHIGVARDLAAVLNCQNSTQTPLNLPDVSAFKSDNQNLVIDVKVEDTEACPRYSGVSITNVQVKASPDWLKNQLTAIGIRPINNIVDITNLVLFETGQPLHVFDAKQVKGKQVIVKKLAKDTPFITLDGVERKLSGNDLMICNAEEGMCIAGVFGGQKSGVTESTTDIFLESAYFNPVSIRKTSKFHGLKTDASFRYERGCDPNITIYALKRAALLMKEIAGGEISSEIIDIYPQIIERKKVEITYAQIHALIGKNIPESTIRNILTSLEIEIEKATDTTLHLLIPTCKVDVTRPVDVIEEILRIYGYNNIEFDIKPNVSLSFGQKPDPERIQNIISDFLTDNGFFEIMNNSLTKAEYLKEIPELKAEENAYILNPLSKDLNVLRQTLLFGGLESVVYNINRKTANLKLYEFGKTYKHNPDKASHPDVTARYTEELNLLLFISGNTTAENWKVKQEKTDFFILKNYAENILKRLRFNILKFNIDASQQSYFAEGMTYRLNNKEILSLGKISAKLLKYFDIKQDVFVAEINWSNILKLMEKNEVSYTAVPKFPSVRRDLALLVDASVSFAEIQKIAYKVEKNLLKNVILFDVYVNEKIEAGKKSYAVGFILQDEEKTLTDKQIDGIMGRLTYAFNEHLQAVIR